MVERTRCARVLQQATGIVVAHSRRPRSSWPTGGRSWRAARSPRSGGTATCSRDGPGYGSCSPADSELSRHSTEWRHEHRHRARPGRQLGRRPGRRLARRRREDIEDTAAAVGVKLRGRSRRLLGSLLRPHRKALLAILVVVLIENAARLSIPWLVKEGIDRGIPPMLDGGSSDTLVLIVAIVGVAVIVQAISRLGFLVLTGKVGQQLLLELRGDCSGTSSGCRPPSTTATPPVASSPGPPPTSTPSRR
jgi:hypothetical protein